MAAPSEQPVQDRFPCLGLLLHEGARCDASPRPSRSWHIPRATGHHFPLQIAGMHPPHVREQALALVAEGLNDCEISRRLGVPRRTILDWRRPTYIRKAPVAVCPRCWRAAKLIRFTPQDYVEFLGLYLGDGCISKGPRTARLRIALDTKYPKIVADAEELLERCFPGNAVDVVPYQKGRCVAISLYCSHLACLLPQHGSGRKHERRIVLEPWQQELLEIAPWSFIKACIRTDGCAFINRTDIHRPQPYEYLSYAFSNKSKDIIDLFVGACDLAGVQGCRVTYNKRRDIWHIRINRRESVQRMVAGVGFKR